MSNIIRTPTKYPAQYSYKHVIDSFKSKDIAAAPRQAPSSISSYSEDSSVSSATSMSSKNSMAGALLIPSLTCVPGDKKVVHKLKDGAILQIITRAKENKVIYHLKCADGRRIFLEKSAESAGLVITDAKGNVVKSLGCDL